MPKMFEMFNKQTTSSDPPPSSWSRSPGLSLRDFLPKVTIASFWPLGCANAAITIRRTCMCGVLGLDTFTRILSIITHTLHFSVIPRIILAILHFFFFAWCLSCIGRMVGERVFMHRVITRWHFDVFLLGCLAWEIMLVGWYFGGLTSVTASAWWGLGILELVAMWFVGWLAWSGPLEEQGDWSQV